MISCISWAASLRAGVVSLMHWSEERDRLTEEQVALVKRQLRRESDGELLRSYGIYLRALQLDEGEPPAASTIQYFVEAWRELRRRKRAKATN